MDALRRLSALVAADLRQRTRQPRFWWLLAFLVGGTWLCLPEAGSGSGMRVSVGDARAYYSSAWIGMALALCGSTLLSLFSFYAVRGSIAHDIDSRGWELLMATPMTRAGYLLAKYLGILATFSLFLLAMALTGAVGQWVRGEAASFQPWELMQPLLLVMLPALAMTAAGIVWFDLMPWLRGTAGNVLFFFVWVGVISAGTASVVESEDIHALPAWRMVADVPGISVMRTDVLPVLAAERPELATDNFNIGGSGIDDPSARFHWDAWAPSTTWLGSRLALLLFGTGLVLAATPLVDWAAARPRQRHDATAQPGFRLRWLDALLVPLQPFAFGRLVAAELRLALRPRGGWWWLAAAITVAVQLGATAEARLAAWLVGLGLALPYLAHALVRDRAADTAELLAVSPQGGLTLALARAAAATLLCLALSLPSLLHAPVAVLASVLSVVGVGFALSRGVGNARATELAYVLGAYMALNGAPLFQAFSQPQRTVEGHGLAALLGLAVVLASSRRRAA